jgi:hypothetical protein
MIRGKQFLTQIHKELVDCFVGLYSLDIRGGAPSPDN